MRPGQLRTEVCSVCAQVYLQKVAEAAACEPGLLLGPPASPGSFQEHKHP